MIPTQLLLKVGVNTKQSAQKRFQLDLEFEASIVHNTINRYERELIRLKAKIERFRQKNLQMTKNDFILFFWNNSLLVLLPE